MNILFNSVAVLPTNKLATYLLLFSLAQYSIALIHCFI